MNRRSFIQSLTAVFSVPAHATLSLQPAAAAIPTAAAVPAKARFWAIYMSGLHGQCTPETLQKLLHIPEADAKSYIGRLTADGVIKPNPFLQTQVSQVLKSREDSLVQEVKDRMEPKPQSPATEIAETAGPEEEPDGALELSEERPEEGSQGGEHSDALELETQLCGETDARGQGGAEEIWVG